MIDIPSQRVGEAERDIGFVAIDDHCDKQPVERVPDGFVVGERRKGCHDTGAVLRDVAAVQAQALMKLISMDAWGSLVSNARFALNGYSQSWA